MIRDLPLFMLGVALAILASCANDRDEAHSRSDNGSWSPIVNGLQARFSVERNEVFDGTPIISVWIEFRNTTDDASPLMIPWKGGVNASYSLTASSNRHVEMGAVAYDGFDVPLETMVIPRGSSLRYYASRSGAGFSPNQKAMIDLGPTATYEVASGDTNAYDLHCTISVPEPGRDEMRNAWHGVLTIPSIAVVR